MGCLDISGEESAIAQAKVAQDKGEAVSVTRPTYGGAFVAWMANLRPIEGLEATTRCPAHTSPGFNAAKQARIATCTLHCQVVRVDLAAKQVTGRSGAAR